MGSANGRGYGVNPSRLPTSEHRGMAEVNNLLFQHGMEYKHDEPEEEEEDDESLSSSPDAGTKRKSPPRKDKPIFNDVVLPPGWSMFSPNKDSCYGKTYYLVNDVGVIKAKVEEMDHDKYRSFSRSGEVITNPDKEFKNHTKWTYPFPYFYAKNDKGYWEVDEESDEGQYIEAMTTLQKMYTKYTKDFSMLCDDQDKQASIRRDITLAQAKCTALQKGFHDGWEEYKEMAPFDLLNYTIPVTRKEMKEHLEVHKKGMEQLVGNFLAHFIEIRPKLLEGENMVVTFSKWSILRDGYYQFLDFLRPLKKFVPKLSIGLPGTNGKNMCLETVDECIEALEKIQTYLKDECVWNDNVSSADEKVIAEFKQKVVEYNRYIEITYGCGARVQGNLDEKWEAMKLMVNNNSHIKELVQLLPKRCISRDDGSQGCATGLGMLASSMVSSHQY